MQLVFNPEWFEQKNLTKANIFKDYSGIVLQYCVRILLLYLCYWCKTNDRIKFMPISSELNNKNNVKDYKILCKYL